MEDYHKKNFSKLYRKSQYGNQDSFNHYKKKYNCNSYDYHEDNFPKKKRINKFFPKSAFNNINSTEKNFKLTEFNPNVESPEKNYSNKEKELLPSTIIKNRNNTNLEIISQPKINLYGNINPNTKITKNDNQKKNNLINTNINQKLIQPPNLSPLYQYYNLPNHNLNNNNINYYYFNFLPTNINNSINNYYINNNIVIYNNNNNNIYQSQHPNLYSILNSYNNIKNMNNISNMSNMNNAYIYTSQNYFNTLFSKNEEKTKKENIIIDPKKENTCILEISLKLTKEKIYNFKLNRFDDLFETVQIFCQINELNSKLYIPILINIMKALNSIYGIFNLKLTKNEINELQMMKYLCFKLEEKSI